jgi:hypothetical protein
MLFSPLAAFQIFIPRRGILVGAGWNTTSLIVS